MKMYAYWEKSSTGNWGLVVYHGEKPGKSSQGADPERHGPFDVPEDMIDTVDGDSTPNMGRIAAAFPNPFKVEPKKEEAIEEPLPDWAKERATKGVIKEMQQLITRDPKARDNATLAEISSNGETFLVVTDANNWIRYTTEELMDAYEPGSFILHEFPNPKSTQQLEAMNDD